MTASTRDRPAPQTILQTLVGKLAAEQVCPWIEATETVRSPIQSALLPTSQPACIVYPQTQAELSAVVACAHQQRWRMLPYGSGSKLHWGGLTDVDIVISTAQMNQLVDHAVGDLTVTAAAGMGLATLQGILAQGSQFLAVDPSYGDRATLGGIVATADTGSLRQRYSVRDMVIGISLVRSDGKVAQAGGRVVKNVAGYDLMKLFTGSWGSLGIISQVTFRIYPLPSASQTVVLVGETGGKSMERAIAAIRTSGLTPTALDWLNADLTKALDLGNRPALLCRFQTLEVSIATQTEQVLALAQACGLRSICLKGTAEAALWQQLRDRQTVNPEQTGMTCKFGVLPEKMGETLARIETEMPGAIALIHGGSGLGWLQWNEAAIAPLRRVRQHCQQSGGFLTILAAPLELRQSADLWGYTGNTIGVMQGLKRQFDSEGILCPGRFMDL